MDRRSKLKRTALLGIVLSATCAAGVVWVARPGPPDPSVVSIAIAPAYQDPELLARAWSLPGARAYAETVSYQSNGSTCGPTSVANLGRSLGDEEDSEDEVLAAGDVCWTGMCIPGITLDELAGLTEMILGPDYDVSIVREQSLAHFREALRELNEGQTRMLANFSRRPLFGRGGGHHSPIASYLEDEDLVLVLDVNADYQPWLVDVTRLHEAMQGIDSQTKRTRGWLHIEPGGS